MTDSEKLDLLLNKMTSMEIEMTSMKSKISSIEYKVTDMQLTLANETNKGIRIIAEEHLDLARRLHDDLRVESDKEIASLRLSMLENEVRRLRDKIEQPA